jgi:FlaA1/EpsC-like NDP-sugar epimerase
MINFLNLNKKTQVILHDLFMSVLAWELAWGARFNFDFPFPDWQKNIYTIPVLVLVQGIIFWRFHLYRGLWRFASLPDLWNIFRASIVGGLCLTLTFFILFRLEGIPRSLLILYPFFLMFLLGAPRLGYRLWKDHSLSFKPTTGNARVLIIGAGRAAEMLIREIMRDCIYLPVAILDDNKSLKGFEIHGVKIYGEIKRTQELVKTFDVDLILIAIPSATSTHMQKILEICEKTNIPIRTLPGIQDMVEDTSALSVLREVSIEDLLGREKIEFDWQDIQKGISNKTILVTGGGGSIGSELCLQIARLGPLNLIVYERSEFNLYNVERKILSHYPKLSLHCILGDLCDKNKVDYIMREHKPDIVFHAAAYKHVPILEKEPREAIRNNVIGTKNIVDAAKKNKCNRFVLISTDKAVNPTNILGMTKRISELYTEFINSESKTIFITVRFGNVLGSDGSVIPLFEEQIKSGGPVTVTHPEITRFFMTIREACQLILQSGSMGKGGEIFVLDMGNPIKISYLAEQLIKLSGLKPQEDVEISYTGLRPGEKMHEELFYENEMREKTTHRKIKLARHNKISNMNIMNIIEQLVDACVQYNEEKILLIMEEAIDISKSNNNVIHMSKTII